MPSQLHLVCYEHPRQSPVERACCAVAALKSAVVAAPAEPGKQRLDSYTVTELSARLRSATDWLVRCSWAERWGVQCVWNTGRGSCGLPHQLPAVG